MKDDYQKIHYGEKILRDLKTKKTKDKSHRFSLLPSSSLEPLLARSGNVFYYLQKRQKMKALSTLHNQVLNVLTLPGALLLTANELIAPAAPTSLVPCVIHLHTHTFILSLMIYSFNLFIYVGHFQ